MILFYKKKTGEIIGTIEGRMHSKDQMNAYISQEGIEIERLICQWKIKKQWIENNNKYTEFEPDNNQKEIFIELDKNPSKVYEYKIDLNTKSLIKI